MNNNYIINKNGDFFVHTERINWKPHWVVVRKNDFNFTLEYLLVNAKVETWVANVKDATQFDNKAVAVEYQHMFEFTFDCWVKEI